MVIGSHFPGLLASIIRGIPYVSQPWSGLIDRHINPDQAAYKSPLPVLKQHRRFPVVSLVLRRESNCSGMIVIVMGVAGSGK